MLRLLQPQSSINPFKQIIADLEDGDWHVVTITYLNKVSNYINKDKPLVFTYGDVFRVLEYLRDNNVVELVPIEDEEPGVYKIRKGY